MALLIGKKLGMTQVFEESGVLVPVSVIEVGPCPVVQVKTAATDGYSAIQIGFEQIRDKQSTKPVVGHFKKAGAKPCRFLREVRVEDPSQYNVGDSLDVSVFDGVASVEVIGTTKGRGFAGTVKRHGFSRGDVTHGSHNVRAPGSVGMCATPSRIFKAKKLPGRMGGARRTAKNLKVVQIDAENNLLYVRGSVPGATNNVVIVRTA